MMARLSCQCWQLSSSACSPRSSSAIASPGTHISVPRDGVLAELGRGQRRGFRREPDGFLSFASYIPSRPSLAPSPSVLRHTHTHIHSRSHVIMTLNDSPRLTVILTQLTIIQLALNNSRLLVVVVALLFLVAVWRRRRAFGRHGLSGRFA